MMKLGRSFLVLLALRSATFARDFNLVPVADESDQMEQDAMLHETSYLRPRQTQQHRELNAYGAPRPRNQNNRANKNKKSSGPKQQMMQPNRKLRQVAAAGGGPVANKKPKFGMAAAANKKQQPPKAQGARKTQAVASPAAAAEGMVPSEQGFDFIIAGFPKCGTTTLLKAFGMHDETDMAASEQCAIASPFQADAKVHKLLEKTLETLSTDPQIKRSFKCPTAMYNYKSIARMEKHSPNTKFVVGMRHPVKMLQSFYNYRITEIKERGLDEPIPPLEEILESGMPWKGVSMQSTRFELFLMQMGKTTVTADQMKDLVGQNYDLAIKPTDFTVFLYTVDQLEDAHPERSANLRNTMQNYIGLQKPIQAFGHENKNHATGKAAHKESIAICDDKWAAVRAKLIEQGSQTAKWLRDEFIHSDEVVIANQEHFLETLESWGTDPCIKTAEK